MSQESIRGPLAVIAAPAIGLGILKLYLHIHSKWRFGIFDYFFAGGALLGALFLLLYKRHSKVILFTSIVFVGIEAIKGVTDYRDHFDLMIAGVSIIYLSFPIVLYAFRIRHRRLGKARTENPG